MLSFRLSKRASAVAEALRVKRLRLLGGRLCGFGFGRGFGLTGVGVGHLAAEALDATGGVDQLLLAGKKRVAGGAYFYDQLALVR